MKWTDAEDIGIALLEKFPGVDPLTVRFTDLREKVVGLAGLKMVLNSTDRETIQKWTHALNDATQHLAEVMMNRSVRAALAGKNVDDV